MKAKDILDLILPIPKEEWRLHDYTDGVSKCCFIGHVTRLLSANPKDYSRNNCTDLKEGAWLGGEVRNLTKKFNREIHCLLADGSNVNNGPTVNGYTEDNPKDRVVHLLHDMIAAGY